MFAALIAFSIRFLIADVRGYTRFTAEHGDEAAARLTGRFAVITQEIAAARDGEVIELRGDEALAVFSSARQALAALQTGAADTLRNTIAPAHERTTAQQGRLDLTRSAIGEEGWATEYRRGGPLSLEDAVQVALEYTGGP